MTPFAPSRPDLSKARWVNEFETWFASEMKAGRPPDALATYDPDENIRFFARTVPGPDGHLYWTGSATFRRNQGVKPRQVRPQRWVWIRENGEIPNETAIRSTCGEEHCVALRHLAVYNLGMSKRIYSDQTMIGAIQVMAMSLGRAPTMHEYQDRRTYPSSAAIQARFGTWGKACKAAGYKPNEGNKWVPTTEGTCISSLEELAEHLGHVPLRSDFDQHSEWLHGRGLLSSGTTIRKRLGVDGWDAAIEKVFGKSGLEELLALRKQALQTNIREDHGKAADNGGGAGSQSHLRSNNHRGGVGASAKRRLAEGTTV